MNSMQIFDARNISFYSLNFIDMQLHVFFVSNTFISNTRLKMDENIANLKQNSEFLVLMISVWFELHIVVTSLWIVSISYVLSIKTRVLSNKNSFPADIIFWYWYKQQLSKFWAYFFMILISLPSQKLQYLLKKACIRYNILNTIYGY